MRKIQILSLSDHLARSAFCTYILLNTSAERPLKSNGGIKYTTALPYPSKSVTVRCSLPPDFFIISSPIAVGL